MKDRKATEEQILASLDRIFTKKGFKDLGVNAVAREAGVSKVLIYRYFESFEGLLEAWALKNSFWVNPDMEITPGTPPAETAALYMSSYIDDLRNNPLKREILRWLLAEKTETGRKVMKKIEEAGVAITKAHSGGLGDTDIEALIALMTAGISYLALMSDRADVFNGLPLNSNEGWDRLIRLMDQIVRESLP